MCRKRFTLALLLFFVCSFRLGLAQPHAMLVQWQGVTKTEKALVSPLDVEKRPLATELFRKTLAAARIGKGMEELNREWNAFGYTLATVGQTSEGPERGPDYWMLMENVPHAIDEGFFAFRVGGASGTKLFLQAPHSMGDHRTGEITFRMFFEGSALAGAWSTSPRTTDCGTGCSDLTHREDSLFQALTIAFAEEYPDSRIVQIHGFDPAARETKEGKLSGVIVASGRKEPSLASVHISEQLTGVSWHSEVRLYGSAVFELGALTNAQSIALSKIGFDGFVHLEFSPDNRMLLASSAKLRRALEQSILATPEDSAVEKIAQQ